MCFLSVVAMVTSRADAQAIGRVLRGRVLDAADSTPIATADVDIIGTSLRHSADANGRFAFADVAADEVVLRARLLGFSAATMIVNIPDGHWRDVTIYLRRLPTTLAAVRINGKMVKVPPRFADVYWRASRGWGTFFSRDDIKKRQPYDIVSLLQTIPGVHAHGSGFNTTISFARCDPNMGPAKVAYYIDGVRRGGDVRELNVVSIADIEAVEVYRGVAQIPGEFLDDACAVVAVWTKSY